MNTIYRLALLIAVLLYPAGVSAENTAITVIRLAPVLDLGQLEFIMSHEREEVFGHWMGLDPKHYDTFWEVYDQYEKEKEELDGKRLRLLGTYASKLATLTADEATELVKQAGTNQHADLALRQKYFEILSKKLDPVSAARFAQLDDMVGMVTRLAILGNAPLIGEGTAEDGNPASSQTPAGSPAQ